MSTITEVTDTVQWNQVLDSAAPSTLLVVSFHAPWAAPCAQMATVLSTLASEYPVASPPSTQWFSINAEELSDISEAYDVTAVPFLVLLRGGQVLETVSGSNAVKVRTAIETHAGRSTETAGANGIAAPVAATNEQPDADPETKKADLFKRLEDLVKAAPVMLFMKGTPSSPQCGFSRQLVGILRENSVKYGFFNILADDEVRQGLKEYAEWPTYPQLWMDGELVGGLDIVSRITRDTGLSRWLTNVARRSRKRWRATASSSRHTRRLRRMLRSHEVQFEMANTFAKSKLQRQAQKTSSRHGAYHFRMRTKMAYCRENTHVGGCAREQHQHG